MRDLEKDYFFNGGIGLDIKILTVRLEGNRVESRIYLR